MSDENICPFSKPLIGKWCECPYAILSERCTGKMKCTREEELRESCVRLVAVLRENSRFVLAITDGDLELTHAQLMKLRCGGLSGMKRVLNFANEGLPAIREIIAKTELVYGDLEKFPFSEIMRDIKEFSHRKKIRKINK